MVLTMSFRSPLLADFSGPGCFFDDEFCIELLHVFPIVIGIDMKTFDELGPALQDLSTKYPDVNV